MLSELIQFAKPKNENKVREALSSCSSFDDVKALNILFHGTCEDIKGHLEPGGDRVFWTAKSPSLSQSYIPRAGVSRYYSKTSHVMDDEYIRPDKYDTPLMLWALKISGYTREDLDITWNENSGMVESWALPDHWPQYSEWDNYLESLGYEAENGYYLISEHADDRKNYQIKPASWKMPGQLLILLPHDDFHITDPEWSDDALGYEPHNRLDDFRSFGESGMDAFRMSDKLQSDYLGNVHHESVGILPSGLEKLDYISIPARRHDGEDINFFSYPETEEFVTFMKELNPSYKSKIKNDVDLDVMESPFC